MQVDVAVQSYRKPEQLLHSLLTLNEVSTDVVDQVFINDDGSPPWVTELYRSAEVAQALQPWRLRVRSNHHRMGWWYAPVHGLLGGLRHRPPSAWGRHLAGHARFAWRSRALVARRDDVRYQWALDTTDKPYLFVMHDDTSFRADVPSLYLAALGRLDRGAVVGDLGQCWRCPAAPMGCDPARVLARQCPHPRWPEVHMNARQRWVCRVNEWCALLSVAAARSLEQSHGVLFGNYDDRGDVGARWFACAVHDGWGFDDPLPHAEQRATHYWHGEAGAGHSVWVDQGKGLSRYDSQGLRARLLSRFGFAWPERFAEAP